MLDPGTIKWQVLVLALIPRLYQIAPNLATMTIPLGLPWVFGEEETSVSMESLETRLANSAYENTEEASGIYQGDFIVQSALRAGIKDVRANPWLWVYIFSSFLSDLTSKAEYGPKLVKSMKDWLIKTDFPVFVNTRLDPAKLPAITINLVDSQETDNTLADIHYQTSVVPILDSTNPEPNPPLCSPFAPVSWDSTTGLLTLPTVVTEETYVFPDMQIRDRIGGLHRIQNVQEINNLIVILLAPGTNSDFSEAVIVSKDPPQTVALESVQDRESYLIGCHVVGESWQLTALHSFVKFVLYRYRETLLEARGFQISAISSTDLSRNQAFESDQAWSRYISLSGKTRSVWPKVKMPQIAGISAGIKVIGGEHLPVDEDPDEMMIIGELDTLNTNKRR